MCANDNDDKDDTREMDDEDSPHAQQAIELIKTLSGKSDEFRVAISTLEDAGCDPVRLGWLLQATVGLKGKRPVSRDDMKNFAAQFEQCGKSIWLLLSSQAAPLLDSELMWLGIKVTKLSREVAGLAPQTDRRTETALDMALAALVKYTKDGSGEFHDDELAAVVSVTLTDAGLRTEDYTTAAHQRWRNRNSHTQFTQGIGLKRVNELLEEMEDEL